MAKRKGLVVGTVVLAMWDPPREPILDRAWSAQLGSIVAVVADPQKVIYVDVLVNVCVPEGRMSLRDRSFLRGRARHRKSELRLWSRPQDLLNLACSLNRSLALRTRPQRLSRPTMRKISP